MLIDTNIFVEMGRRQAKSDECRDLFDAIVGGRISEEVHITRFSLSAIQAMLAHLNPDFVRKILLAIYCKKIKLFNTSIDDDISILSSLKQLGLDFDDAIQFFAANKLGTYLVSYDKDFTKSGLATKSPKEILKDILI